GSRAAGTRGWFSSSLRVPPAVVLRTWKPPSVSTMRSPAGRAGERGWGQVGACRQRAATHGAGRGNGGRENGMPGNDNAPAGGSAGRHGLEVRDGAGGSTPPGRAAAIPMCGDDFRIVERVRHRPVSGQMAMCGFEPSGNPTLRQPPGGGKRYLLNARAPGRLPPLDVNYLFSRR